MAKKKTEEGPWYVLTADGPLAGLKVWRKNTKTIKSDIQFQYGCLDRRLLNYPLEFTDKETAQAFRDVYSCFIPQAVVADEADVREWMAEKEKQRDQYQAQTQET